MQPARPLLFSLLLTAFFATHAAVGFYCPAGCNCFQRSVRCIRARLTAVPTRFPQDTNMLDLRFNHFEEIPAEAFADLPQLNTLFLNENQIGVLHEDAFAGLKSLRFLYLSNNRISRLPDKLFQHLPKLEALYLENNDIWQFSTNTFHNLPKLNRLFLFNNKITSIPSDGLTNLPNLKRLRLDGNPIDCDCGVYSLWRYYQQHPQRNQITIKLTCESPAELHRRGFDRLQEQNFHCKKPVILNAPHDMQLQPGESVELPCQMSGDPEPEIVWMQNTNEISVDYSPRMQILPTGNLRINDVDMNDIGIYECIGRNEVGETKTQPIRMMVETAKQQQQQQQQQHQRQQHTIQQNQPPRFTRTPTDQTVKINGAAVLLDCTADGVPPPEIRWFHNGRLVTQSTETIIMAANGSLVIVKPIPQSAGAFRCEATNEVGSIQTAARIEVKELPEILIAPQNQTVKLGKSFILECDADGNPIPILKWKFNGSDLVSNTRVQLENENTELTVKKAQESDTGIYTCIALNENGVAEVSAKITVERLQGPPKLLIEPYDLEALAGTTIEVPCRVEDEDESLEITWRRDGRLINSNIVGDKYRISSTGSLYVKNVTIFEGGRYECSVKNEFGRVTASALITVKNNNDLAPGDRYVRIAFAEAAREIDIAINNTIEMLFTNRTTSNGTLAPPNYADLLRVFRFPTGEARQVARAAEIYERTLVNIRKHVLRGDNLTVSSDKYEFRDLLSRDHLRLVAELSGCMEHRETPNCTDMCYHSKYRSIDGTCNNLHHPIWGASLTAFRRLARPIYENGFSMPIGWTKNKLYAGYPKPSSRLVSTTLISTKDITPDDTITHMVMQWGQFLDHDLDHAIPSVSSESWDGVDCKKTCEFAPPCYPIEVPPNDPRIKNRRCIDLVRSSSICGSGMTSVFFDSVQHREQINQLTSYIDASQVYGYSYEYAQELRNLTADEGLLRVGVKFPKQKSSMPFAAPQYGIDCRRNLDENTMSCFASGDIRSNEQVGLLAIHTIWLREHNRIAGRLRDINPHWDGDTLYQEARKIVGAQMQHITYQHWLPLIVGESGMQLLGEYRGYDPSVEATIANEFATAALRFGHTIINPVLHRLNSSYQPIERGHLPLHKAFFAPWRLPFEGGVDPLMRGMFSVPAKLKTPDQNLNSELTEKLFHTQHAVSLDLAAINIQRGRDHGIPGYNVYREFCNFTKAETFDDLQQEISDAEIRRKLQDLYGHPDNIDVWVGGILEDQVPGGKVGPLFQCLLIEQFRRLRDGDRFYYENPSVFLPEQLQQIKRSNLARVLCDNGDNIEEITDDVFLLPKKQGGYKKCEDVAGINLYLWQDCAACSSLPPVFETYVPQTYVKETRRRKRSLGLPMNEERSDFAESSEQNNLEDLYEVNEERVSGLEEVIGSFQKELKKLHKKIRKLEESCVARMEPHVQSSLPAKPKRNHCVDKAGNTRLLNEVWSPDACTKCECRHAQITCTRENCPSVECEEDEEVLTPPEACCAHCVRVGKEEKKLQENTT